MGHGRDEMKVICRICGAHVHKSKTRLMPMGDRWLIVVCCDCEGRDDLPEIIDRINREK